MSLDSLKNVIDKMCLQFILTYMYKEDLALNHQQLLICYKIELLMLHSNTLNYLTLLTYLLIIYI